VAPSPMVQLVRQYYHEVACLSNRSPETKIVICMVVLKALTLFGVRTLRQDAKR
jgi:hypothetical protein